MILLILIFTLIIYFELKYRNINSHLKIKVLSSYLEKNEKSLIIKGCLSIINSSKKLEIMVPQLTIKTLLLGNNDYSNISQNTRIHIKDSTSVERKDSYLESFIVKTNSKINISYEIIFNTEKTGLDFNKLTAIWLDINWINYGPFGILERKYGFTVPINNKIINGYTTTSSLDNSHELLAIKTHILGVLDNPYEVLDRFTKDIRKKGDILTIGETPLAIMQGRYMHFYVQ